MIWSCSNLPRYYGIEADGSVGELHQYNAKHCWRFRHIPQHYDPKGKKRWQKHRRLARKKRVL